MTEHVQGTDGVMALINLALLTGNIGKPGAGVNPLRGQNNVQGAAHMGCDPGHVAGIDADRPGTAAVERMGRAVPTDARLEPAGDDGRGRRRPAQGLCGRSATTCS